MRPSTRHIALSVALVLWPCVCLGGTTITSFDELAEAPASTDQLVIVDVSDTTMAATGTTKRIGVSNLVGATADASYLRLDATNDPLTAEVHFGAGIRGDEAGCSTPTELTIDGAPGNYGGNDYGVDLLSGECPASAVAAVNEEFTAFLTICSGEEADISVVFDALGTDSVRLCMIDFSDVIGEPGLFASFLMPSSDTCTGFLDTVFEGPGHGVTADIDDPAFLKWNSSTCTYDDRDRLNTYTIVSGWDDPVDVTTDSEMTYEWKITDSGDATCEDIVADSFRIGNPLVGSTFFADLVVNPDTYTLSGTTDLASYAMTIQKAFDSSAGGGTGSAGGLYVSVSAMPEHDMPHMQFQAANYESLLYTDNIISGMEVIRFLNYAWGDFTITGDYTTISADGPKISLANSDPTVPTYRGIKINDWEICGTCTVTLTDNIGIDIGALTAGTNNYGIRTAADIKLMDDVALIFGDDEDVYLSTSTADRLDITPSTSNGDVTLVAVGSGGLVTDGSFQAASYKAGSGTAGMTDNTSYWLCTAADCSSTCQATIEDGLITGCP